MHAFANGLFTRLTKASSWALSLTLAGCSLVLDGSRHVGGDAGDAGDDGGDVEVCERPPTAACGVPVDEQCPPLPQSQLASIFPGLEPLGQLRPTVLVESVDGILPEIAMGAVEDEGELHGTAIVLAIEQVGPARHVRRVDVPLHDLLAAETKPLLYSDGDEMVEIPNATSVAIARESSSQPILGMVIGDSGGLQMWSAQTNVVTLETNVSRTDVTAAYGFETLYDGVGAVPGFSVFRGADDLASVWLRGGYNQMISGPPVMLNESTSGVPGGDLRVVTTSGYDVMLQDEEGSFWTWPLIGVGDPAEHPRPGQSGKAAWASVDLENHVLVYEVDGTVYFEHFLCDVACDPAPIISDVPSIATVAPSGEAPSAIGMPDGRVAALVTERYAEGDRLVLQLLDATLVQISIPRVVLLDLRGSGERVADAELQYVEAPSGTTLLVAAAIGAEVDLATRIVLTGLRSCATNG